MESGLKLNRQLMALLFPARIEGLGLADAETATLHMRNH